MWSLWISWEKTLEGTSLAPKNREIKANIPELTYNGNPQPVDPYLTMTNNAGGLLLNIEKKAIIYLLIMSQLMPELMNMLLS